jgi:hypothetical protein
MLVDLDLDLDLELHSNGLRINICTDLIGTYIIREKDMMA